ncbi:hypothetical protein N7540_005966 [Penicillium herquei]|nr:hypothetical protein N7540_005966 [Penicillium herquei]
MSKRSASSSPDGEKNSKKEKKEKNEKKEEKKDKKDKKHSSKKSGKKSEVNGETAKVNGVSNDETSNKRKSPWDECERYPVDFDSLDLNETTMHDLSDEEEVEVPPHKKAKKNPKWEHKGPKPLIDPEQLPEGWTATEPDLDTFDIDGQIARCHERIQANIMPMVFEQRLKEYQAVKDRQIYQQNLYPDLTPGVIERIFSLRKIYSELETIPSHDGVQFNGSSKMPEFTDMVAARERKARQQENIKAVMLGYLSGNLEWMEGYVTYWSKGKQLCQPRLFDWDEFEAIYDRVDGNSSFWTEGYKMALRIPGYKWWYELEFMHDTGATMMALYRGDIRTLMGPFGPPNDPPLRVAWTTVFYTANGPKTQEIVQVEATILDANGQRLAPWTRIQACLMDGDHNPGMNARMDGPWLRYMMYFASVPDGNLGLYIADTQNNLVNGLPAVNPHVRSAPRRNVGGSGSRGIRAPPGTTAPPTRAAPSEAIVPREPRPLPPLNRDAVVPHLEYPDDMND